MRIRKNARVITPSSSCSSKSFLVCQLNRSPWDVDSSFQGECENGFDGLAQGFPSSNSLFSAESMELSYEYVEKTMPPPPPSPPPQLEIEERESEGIGGHKDGNNDNRNNGWQHIHHQLKPPPLKVGPPLPPIPTAPKKRGRPKKPTPATNATTTTTTTTTTPTANNNNPYEFYYYSGFGPSWNRRRGVTNKYTTSGIVDGSNCGNTRINDGENSLGCSSSSLVMSEDDVKDDDDSKNNNNSVVVMESVVEGELDYIEDDFDDDDDEDGSNLGRRRVRKPVKARSLKSLM